MYGQPSFDFEIGQVKFLVLISDYSVTTDSALAETHVLNLFLVTCEDAGSHRPPTVSEWLRSDPDPV